MFHNSTTIHPCFSHQGPSSLWSGNGNLSSIKLEKKEEPVFDSGNNGESETMDFEYFNSNIANNCGVISKEEECALPMLPPLSQGQGQPRVQLQSTIKLPSKKFCLNRGLPHLNLVMKFEDEEAQVLKIDLHQFLGSLCNPPPLSEEKACSSENTNTSNSSPAPPPLTLTPPSSNSSRSGDQLPIPLDILPEKKLGPRTSRPTPRNIKKQVNPIVGGRNPPTKDKTRERTGWRYPCYFCHKRFKARNDLHHHISIHTTEKPYSCDKCRNEFNQASHLASHRRLHDPATRPFFPCEECDKTFSRKEHMTRHMKTVHLGVKEIQCPECDWKFGRKSHMMRHLKNIHFRIRIPCPQQKIWV